MIDDPEVLAALKIVAGMAARAGVGIDRGCVGAA